MKVLPPMRDEISDEDFLKLKIRYYNEGHNPKLSRNADAAGQPGGTNNQTQNALRWGYNQAVRDIKNRVIENILGPFEAQK